jgi:hypothetical protein
VRGGRRISRMGGLRVERERDGRRQGRGGWRDNAVSHDSCFEACN